jgi:uncharacterized protein
MTFRALAVLALLGTVASLALADAAEAATPSFDCDNASAPIETIICGDDDLATLDADMAHAYEARQQGLRRDQLLALRREQAKWLRDRIAACDIPTSADVDPPDAAVDCLAELYRKRIEALTGTTPAAAQTAAPATPVDGVDRDEKVFTVDRAGRYALRLESKSGAGLQVIDRMAGPSPVAGEIGKQDGRLDLLLDRGSYKALMLTPEGSGDHPALRVDGFRELDGTDLPRLVELKPVAADLADLTQRSWWIEITERRVVAIEAAGRYLADLRLWKDGNWLVDAPPVASEVEPEPGQPLALRQLVTTLEPGLYLLTAYGGPGAPWSKESDAKPFYLRFGIPTLAEAERRRAVASLIGIDRYLVPKPANWFRLALDAPDAAALTVKTYDPAAPFAAGGSRGAIAKNSRIPAADVASSPGGDFQLVTVERRPGQPYLLQSFLSAANYDFPGDGDYWIEVENAAISDDDADLTAVLTEDVGRNDVRERPRAWSAIEVGHDKPWQRRFNLLGRLTFYVFVATGGDYRITAAGENVDAEFRFALLGYERPAGYDVPDFERGDHLWTLEAGLYELTVAPRKRGIATLTLVPEGYGGAVVPAPRLSVAAFRSQRLQGDGRYHLYVGRQPEIENGLVLRRRPIDLAQGLPMTLRPHERVDIPATLPAGKEGKLSAIAADGKAIDVALDGAPPAASARVAPGAHRVVVANSGNEPLALALTLEREDLQPEAPLPVMTAERLKALPSFPTLSPETPVFLDAARQQQHTFNVAVTAPALYRLETGGLLRTAGNLRTRMVTSLARAEANGVGRNFLIQNYLREGDYQLSLAPAGDSVGHMSLRLTAAPIAERGALSLGLPARAPLSPGGGVRYDFRIDRKATYHLAALGMDRTFPIRVEDADGWPVGAPINPAGELTQVFLPGLYHVTLLPTAVEGRSLTLLEERTPPAEYRGHGPHALPFDDEVAAEWLEPTAGEERVPDRWRFRLPAPADVTLAIGDGMVGVLHRQGGGEDSVVAPPHWGPGWRLSLAAGDYELQLRSIIANNHLPYTLSLKSEQLLIGEKREIAAPSDLELSLGGNDLVEISSFGTDDVRARLYDAAGRLVAANDDRADDWNFAIAASLAAGRYHLKVDPVGSDKAKTRIELFRPEETSEPPLPLPGSAKITDAALHTYPLALGAEAGLLVIAASSRETTSLALERMSADGTWKSIALAGGRSPVVALPLAAGESGRYRLRAWATDRKPGEIAVVARLATPSPASERDLIRGLTPARLPDIEPPLFVAAVTPAQQGVLRLAGADAQLAWSSAAGTPAAGDPAGLVIAGDAPIWLVDRAPRALSATRVDFDRATRLLLPPGPSAIAFAAKPFSGPALWRAEARFGQPGIVAGAVDRAPSAMGIAETSSVAVTEGGAKALLHLWNAGEPAEPLQVTLQRIDFAATESQALPPGSTDVSLGARAARLYALGSGVKRLHLVLPAATAAVLRQGETTLATLWTDRASRAATLELAADSVLLLHAGDGDAEASIGWNALADAQRADRPAALTLTAERLFKRYDGAAGELRLEVAPPVGSYKLRVHGSPAEASFVAADGRVTRGRDLALSGPGTLLIDHGPGLVAAWIENPMAIDEPSALALDATPRIVKLKGEAMRFSLAAEAPVLLSARTTAPVIATVVAPDGSATTEAFAEGGRLSRYLPAGTASLLLQSAAEGPLAGDAEFVATPVVPIDEGLGQAVPLGAGETRLFGFTLAQEQTIGVGLSASVDIVNCRLLDAGGKTLGTGIVEMHKLPPGAYVLAVTAPADAAPIAIRPALVGVRPPDTGPPDDVKRKYLQLVGRLPSE